MRRLLIIFGILYGIYFLLSKFVLWSWIILLLKIILCYYAFRVLVGWLFSMWWNYKGSVGYRKQFPLWFIFQVLYGKIFISPKIRKMEKYIMMRGWKPYRFDNGEETRELWVNPIYKDNGYDKSGTFSLYGAYERSRRESGR